MAYLSKKVQINLHNFLGKCLFSLGTHLLVPHTKVTLPPKYYRTLDKDVGLKEKSEKQCQNYLVSKFLVLPGSLKNQKTIAQEKPDRPSDKIYRNKIIYNIRNLIKPG